MSTIREAIAILIADKIFTNYNLKIKAVDVKEVLDAINAGTLYSDDELLHNDLDGLNVGDYKHLTAIQMEQLVTIINLMSGAASNIQNQINNKVNQNTIIVPGADKTKVTYDAKGLILSATDATTADIDEDIASDRFYVSSAQKVIIDSVSTQIATAISNLVDSSPTTLDTLNEFATALGDDPNFATTIMTLLGGKQSTLVSGTNLKTLGGVSLLGSGNIDISFSIPQSNKIFINSDNGVNLTGRGNVNTPYLTPEFVFTDIINTGTITATTSNGNNTLTAVSSTSNIIIGQQISGSGIPWGTIVESKTSNTIVLSQKCTASATITVKWLTLYELNLSGNFIATSNWFKEGFYFARNKSVNVIWGAFTLYEINTLQTADYFNDGGFNYSGTTTTSKYFDITLDQNAEFDFTLNHSTLNSVTTGHLFFHGGVWSLNGGRYKIKGETAIAKFGTVSTTPYYFASKIIVDITYSYGLLGGVIAQANASNLAWNGNIDTPASVLAVSMPESCFNYTGEWINGSVSIVGSSKVDFSPRSIVGTTCTLGNVVTTSSITQAVTCTNNVDFFGSCVGGAITFTGVNNRMYGTTLYGPNVSGSGVCEVFTQNFLTNSTSVSGTGTLIIRSNRYSGINFAISVASGAKLINYGEIVIDNVYSINMVIGGTLINHNTLTFTQGGFDSIQQDAGSTIINNGTIQATHAVNTVALIKKVGGTLTLNPNSSLKVGNAKPPLRCTLNTSDSKDILMFWTKSNGNGSTYGLYFAFDGSSYMPNDLVGGQLYENTTD